MRISLVGMPGSGKTTLAHMVGVCFKTIHIQSGELARAHGFAGSNAENNGELDPDEQKIRSLVKEAIGDANAYILDGFPRMIEQIEEVGIDLDAVLYLRMNDFKIAKNRLLKRARPDDTDEIIDKRLKNYFKYTYPLVNYFINKEILIEIDASGPIAETLGHAVLALAENGEADAKKYVRRLIECSI